jgi:hypothetical protein
MYSPALVASQQEGCMQVPSAHNKPAAVRLIAATCSTNTQHSLAAAAAGKAPPPAAAAAAGAGGAQGVRQAA